MEEHCDVCRGVESTVDNPIVLCSDRGCLDGRHRRCWADNDPPSLAAIARMQHRCYSHGTVRTASFRSARKRTVERAAAAAADRPRHNLPPPHSLLPVGAAAAGASSSSASPLPLQSYHRPLVWRATLEWNCQQLGVELGPSSLGPASGNGVKSLKGFDCGALVGYFNGKFIPLDEWQALVNGGPDTTTAVFDSPPSTLPEEEFASDASKGQWRCLHPQQVGDSLFEYVCLISRQCPMGYINDPRRPDKVNVAVQFPDQCVQTKEGVLDWRMLPVYATKVIATGAELFIDYGWTPQMWKDMQRCSTKAPMAAAATTTTAATVGQQMNSLPAGSNARPVPKKARTEPSAEFILPPLPTSTGGRVPTLSATASSPSSPSLLTNHPIYLQLSSLHHHHRAAYQALAAEAAQHFQLSERLQQERRVWSQLNALPSERTTAVVDPWSDSDKSEELESPEERSESDEETAAAVRTQRRELLDQHTMLTQQRLTDSAVVLAIRDTAFRLDCSHNRMVQQLEQALLVPPARRLVGIELNPGPGRSATGTVTATSAASLNAIDTGYCSEDSEYSQPTRRQSIQRRNSDHSDSSAAATISPPASPLAALSNAITVRSPTTSPLTAAAPATTTRNRRKRSRNHSRLIRPSAVTVAEAQPTAASTLNLEATAQESSAEMHAHGRFNCKLRSKSKRQRQLEPPSPRVKSVGVQLNSAGAAAAAATGVDRLAVELNSRSACQVSTISASHALENPAKSNLLHSAHQLCTRIASWLGFCSSDSAAPVAPEGTLNFQCRLKGKSSDQKAEESLNSGQQSSGLAELSDEPAAVDSDFEARERGAASPTYDSYPSIEMASMALPEVQHSPAASRQGACAVSTRPRSELIPSRAEIDWIMRGNADSDESSLKAKSTPSPPQHTFTPLAAAADAASATPLPPLTSESCWPIFQFNSHPAAVPPRQQCRIRRRHRQKRKQKQSASGDDSDYQPPRSARRLSKPSRTPMVDPPSALLVGVELNPGPGRDDSEVSVQSEELNLPAEDTESILSDDEPAVRFSGPVRVNTTGWTRTFVYQSISLGGPLEKHIVAPPYARIHICPMCTLHGVDSQSAPAVPFPGCPPLSVSAHAWCSSCREWSQLQPSQLPPVEPLLTVLKQRQAEKRVQLSIAASVCAPDDQSAARHYARQSSKWEARLLKNKRAHSSACTVAASSSVTGATTVPPAAPLVGVEPNPGPGSNNMLTFRNHSFFLDYVATSDDELRSLLLQLHARVLITMPSSPMERAVYVYVPASSPPMSAQLSTKRSHRHRFARNLRTNQSFQLPAMDPVSAARCIGMTVLTRTEALLKAQEQINSPPRLVIRDTSGLYLPKMVQFPLVPMLCRPQATIATPAAATSTSTGSSRTSVVQFERDSNGNVRLAHTLPQLNLAAQPHESAFLVGGRAMNERAAAVVNTSKLNFKLEWCEWCRVDVADPQVVSSPPAHAALLYICNSFFEADHLLRTRRESLCFCAQHFNTPTHQAHFDGPARLAGAQHRLLEMEQSEFRLRAWEMVQARYARADLEAARDHLACPASQLTAATELIPNLMDIDIEPAASLPQPLSTAAAPVPPLSLASPFSPKSWLKVELPPTPIAIAVAPAELQVLNQLSRPVAVSSRKRVASRSCCHVELPVKRVHLTLTPLPASHPALAHCALRAVGRRCARLKQEHGLLLTWARAFAPAATHPALVNVAFSTRRILRQQQQEERLLKWARAYVAPPAAPLVGVELNPGPAGSTNGCDVNSRKRPRCPSSTPSSTDVAALQPFNSLPRFLVHCIVDFLPTTSIVCGVAPLSREFHSACLDYAATVGSMSAQRRELRIQLAKLTDCKVTLNPVGSAATNFSSSTTSVGDLLTGADRVALMLRAGRVASNNPELTLRELAESAAQQLTRLHQLRQPTTEDKAAASRLRQQLELMDAQEAQILSGNPCLLALLPTAWCDCPFGRAPTRPNFTATERAAQLREPHGAFGLLGFYYMQATYRVDAQHYHAQVQLAQQTATAQSILVIDRSLWEDVLEHHETILRFYEADHSATSSAPAALVHVPLLPMAVRMRLGLRFSADAALLHHLRAHPVGSIDQQIRLHRMVTCRLHLIACSELQALADGYEAGEGDPSSTRILNSQASLDTAQAQLDYHVWGRMAVAEAKRLAAASADPTALLVGVELNPGPVDLANTGELNFDIAHNSLVDRARSPSQGAPTPLVKTVAESDRSTNRLNSKYRSETHTHTHSQRLPSELNQPS